MDICRVEQPEETEGPESDLDEMWSYVGKKDNPRWLWHAIDHHTGKVLAYVFGRRKDEVLLQLKKLLEPFGISRYYTDGWGAVACVISRRRNMPLASSIPRGLKVSISTCELGLSD